MNNTIIHILKLKDTLHRTINMQTRSLEFDRSNFANDILVYLLYYWYESKLKKKPEGVRECVRVNIII